MADFDITNINSKNSFIASLKKRKAFGLSDSDSEDDQQPIKKPEKKKPATNSRTNSSSISLNDDDDAEEVANSNSNTVDQTSTSTPQVSEDSTPPPQPNPYLQGPDLDLIKALADSPVKSLANSPAASQHSEKHIERSTSPIELDDDEDEEAGAIENLDPELEALLHSTPNRVVHEPEKITIKLQYVLDDSNFSEKQKRLAEKLVKPMKMIIMDNTQFDKILGAFCKHKLLKKSDTVLVYNNDTVFLTGTPAGLGMNSTTPNIVQVYKRNDYESLLQEKEQQKQERLKKWAESNKEEDIFDSAEPPTPENPVEDSNKFKIILRSKNGRDIGLKVKNESRIQSVIAKYKEIEGISGSVNLSFEGEVLDPESTIGDADMEDEDLVEVIVAG